MPPRLTATLRGHVADPVVHVRSLTTRMLAEPVLLQPARAGAVAATVVAVAAVVDRWR